MTPSDSRASPWRAMRCTPALTAAAAAALVALHGTAAAVMRPAQPARTAAALVVPALRIVSGPEGLATASFDTAGVPLVPADAATPSGAWAGAGLDDGPAADEASFLHGQRRPPWAADNSRTPAAALGDLVRATVARPAPEWINLGAAALQAPSPGVDAGAAIDAEELAPGPQDPMAYAWVLLFAVPALAAVGRREPTA